MAGLLYFGRMVLTFSKTAPALADTRYTVPDASESALGSLGCAASRDSRNLMA